MLKTRILTALVLVPLLVASVLMLPTQQLAWLFGLFVLLGAWEWSRLAGFTSPVARLGYVLLVGWLMKVSFHWFDDPQRLYYLLYIVFVWWLFVLLWLSISVLGKMMATALNVYLRALIGLILLLPTWISMLALHQQAGQGPWLLLALFVLIWAADSGAYFAGRAFGREKLAPAISPGKTMAGVYGALSVTLLIAMGIAVMSGFPVSLVIAYASIAMFCVVFSIIGDLFESVAKRAAGVKDSGQLIPGHGGVLDRIDSLTAAAPLYLLGLSWFPGLL